MNSVTARPLITGSIMSRVTTSGAGAAQIDSALAIAGLANDFDAGIGGQHLQHALSNRQGILDHRTRVFAMATRSAFEWFRGAVPGRIRLDEVGPSADLLSSLPVLQRHSWR